MTDIPPSDKVTGIPASHILPSLKAEEDEVIRMQVKQVAHEILPLKLPKGKKIQSEHLSIILPDSKGELRDLSQLSTEIEAGVEFLEKVIESATNPAVEESERIMGLVEEVTKPVGNLSEVSQLYNRVKQSAEAFLTTELIPKQHTPDKSDLPEAFPLGPVIGLGIKGVTTLVSIGNFFLKQKEINHLEELKSLLIRDINLLDHTPGGEEKAKELKKEVIELAEKISLLEDELKDQKSEFIVNFGISMPSTAGNALLVAKWFQKIQLTAQVLVPLQIASAVSAVISAGIEMREAVKQESLHSEKLEGLQPLHQTTGDAQDFVLSLLNKRKAAFQLRLEKYKIPFNKLILSLTKGNEGSLKNLNQELEKNGIFIQQLTDRKISNPDELAEALRQDPDLKSKMLTQYVDYRDSLTTSAKDLLKMRLLEVEKINKSFFTFKSTKAKALFSIAVIVAASIITLGGLVLAGFAFPLFVFTFPGLVVALASVTSIVVGLDFLRRHKPNAFKMMLKGTYFQRWLYRVPVLLNKWRLDRAALSLKQNRQTLEFLSTKVNSIHAINKLHIEFEGHVPSSLDAFYQALSKMDSSKLTDEEVKEKLEEYRDLQQKEMFRYEMKKTASEEDVDSLEKKYANAFKRFNSVETRLKKARLKDLGLATGFKVSNKEEQKRVKAFVSQQAREKDYTYKIYDLKPIVEALIKGEFWRDPQARTLIKSYTGVDLPEDTDAILSKETEDDLAKKLEEILENSMLRSSASLKKWLHAH